MSPSMPAEPIITFLKEFAGFTAARIYLLKIDQFTLTDPESKINIEKGILMQHLGSYYKNPTDYFTSRLFITYVAAFEIFLQETLALVIKKDPKKVGNIKFSMADIIDSSNTDQLIHRATEEYLNALMYKKPSEYLSEICKVLAIQESSISCNWGIFIEAKARRDLGVHNAWKCNEIYIRKIKESGGNPALSIGENATPQDNGYLDSVVNTLNSLAQDITREVFKKHWPDFVLPKRT